VQYQSGIAKEEGLLASMITDTYTCDCGLKTTITAWIYGMAFAHPLADVRMEYVVTKVLELDLVCRRSATRRGLHSGY